MEEGESWSGQVQGLRGTPLPNINLLGTEPYTTGAGDTVSFRSTTYDAKYVECAPFEKGVIDIQDSHENDQRRAAFDGDELSLSHLYSIGYYSYMQQQKTRGELSFQLPPAPPDFDGTAPTNQEAVAQYVRGLATAYNSECVNPTPFEIYQHVLLRSSKVLLTPGVSNQQVTEGDPNNPVAGEGRNHEAGSPSRQLPRPHSPQQVQVSTVDDTERLLQMASCSPELETEALAVSLHLVSLSTLNEKGIQLLFRKLREAPSLCAALATDVLESGLACLESVLGDERRPAEEKNGMCSLLGLLVTRRGRVREVVEYLRILEGYQATSSSIVPATMPHARELMDSFSFNTAGQCPITSPIDCYQEEPEKLKISLGEGASVQCFCVSHNRKHLAVSTAKGISIFEIATGDMVATVELSETNVNCWSMSFSNDGQQLICTDAVGVNHTVYSVADFTVVDVLRAASASIPVRDFNEDASTLKAPYLPSGRNSSMHLFCLDEPLVLFKSSVTQPVEHMTVCAYVYQDFRGLLLKLKSGNDEMSVYVEQDVIRMCQGELECFGVVPSTSLWRFIEVRWARGAWSLHVNASIVDLRGPRCGQSKTFIVDEVACMEGVGHVGGVAVWFACNDATAVRAFARERGIESGVKALLSLPMDEGEGFWLKEVVHGTCYTIPETCFVWDDKVLVPCAPCTTPSRVSLEPKQLLEGRVMTSAFKIYLILPAPQKGSDDITVEVDRRTSTITRVYRCPRCCSENRYALLYDESELMVYEQRFNTFSSIHLQRQPWKEHELASSGLLECSSAPGSVEWVLHEMYKRVFLESGELQRIPLEYSPLSLSNLLMLTKALRSVTPTTRKLKVLALLSFTAVHFKKLIALDEKQASQIAASLKNSCKSIMEAFPEKIIRSVAADLFETATLKLLTLDDKAEVLLHANTSSNVDLLKHYLSQESMLDVVNFIVTQDPAQILVAARNLLERCQFEEAEVDGGRPVTRLLVWFVLASVGSLHAVSATKAISTLLELFLDAAKDCVGRTGASNEEFRHRTLLSTGVIPLMVMIAHHCPSAVTEKAEGDLISLIRTIKPREGTSPTTTSLASSAPAPSTVSFTIRLACDVYPPTREENQMWRFLLDFSYATNVSILKERSTPEIRVLNTEGQRPAEVVITHDTPFAKLEGGKPILFGRGENSFTAMAQYDLKMDTSFAAMLIDAAQHLLMSYVAFLTEKPPASEVLVAPLLRHGLTSAALARHNIVYENRKQTTSIASDILYNREEGKAFTDQVCQNMRGSIVPSMRPAIQALLAILVHTGASLQQAEDELRMRWFSGDWGTRLQGPIRSQTETYLRNLATWLVTSTVSETDSTSPYTRRISCDRRYDSSITSSRSLSERRGSTTSRRSMAKSSLQTDALDQVRSLASKDVSPEELEALLVERTRAAVRIHHGLHVLRQLSSIDHALRSESALVALLRVLWRFTGVGNGVHYIEPLNGSGSDVELMVRDAFHDVLEKCVTLLLGGGEKHVSPPAVLTEPAVNGKATMMLMAIVCHPWDVVDCELFGSHGSDCCELLKRIEEQMNIPLSNLTITCPWRVRRSNQVEPVDVLSGDERLQRAEYMGASDLTSLSRLLPNDFSIVIPQFQVSRTEEGVLVEKNSTNSGLLRADESWPLTWKEGVPRVFYYEVEVHAHPGELAVGLFSSRLDPGIRGLELPYFYKSTGVAHCGLFPTFGEGDTVGCGLISTSRTVFFTLNGKFVSFVDKVTDKYTDLFPAIRFDGTTGLRLLINFGTTAFCYDYRQLHPTLSLARGPTWYRVASTAEIALHYLTTRSCSVHESKRSGARVFLTQCCEVVCRNVNKVTSSLMNIGVGMGTADDAGIRLQQAVVLSVAEYSIIVLIATLRHIVRASPPTAALPEVVSEMVFDATSILMLLPLHSIQIATISLLPEVIPHVKRVPEGVAVGNLVHALFDHANSKTEAAERIPFIPMWWWCDPRCMAIANVQFAYMIPEAQRSIVLGDVLPRTGVVSFTVRVTRRNMSKGHSLKGGYFIGVSVAGLTPLSPTSNSQSWKTVKPPIVWALHDTSPQLPHATNPTVKPNNFQRTFGNDDCIKVVVDRDKQTIDFYRDDEFLKTLFSDVPANIDLVPFAQLYNDDANALIGPGEMTAPISAPTLLSAASVDVLRLMLTLEPFQMYVAKGLCNELDTQPYPKVSLALFNSVPDPRVLQLRHRTGEELFITVSRIGDMRCKFSIGDEANYEHLYNLRTPAKPKITCNFDAKMSVSSRSGLSLCIQKLVGALIRTVTPLITTHAFSCLEQQRRQLIIEEERDHWDYLFYGVRVRSFLTIQNASLAQPLLIAPRVAPDYAFSAESSHPSFNFIPQYCGRLATVPSGSASVTVPFIAIAEPRVPSNGRFSIRCQLIRGHSGQILGGGYYFGVCRPSLSWKSRDLNSGTPEVWAIHDMDDAPWRLRHMITATTFPIATEPRCIIISGDIIRLEINRDEGTMEAFRKPVNGDETSMGMIFDNIPKGDLYPFVHLFNPDAVAILLPSEGTAPAIRLPVQQSRFSMSPASQRRNCDGCSAQHLETKLSSRWYKCSECADYALCKNCFDLCVHSYHPFAEMGVNSLLHSTAAPCELRVGMKVVIPAPDCMYLRSGGCKMREEDMNCVVEAVEDNAFAIWGLVGKGTAVFTARVDTTSGAPLSMEHPMFIGFGHLNDFVQLSREKLRSKCFDLSSNLVTYSNDPTLRRQLQGESLHPYGFKRGSTITFEINLNTMVVTISRDWVVVGSRELTPTAAGAAAVMTRAQPEALCCFVAFGEKGARVSVFPERCRTLSGEVEDVANGLVTVVSPAKTVRFVTKDNCRLPLFPCVNKPEEGRLGYTFVDRRLVQCRCVLSEKDDVSLSLLESNTIRTVSLAQFLIDESNAIAEERLLYKEAGESGATLESGFVVSRLLLILSCLCENATLSSLVMQYSDTLHEVLKLLGSVRIGNEAPLDVLGEIRHSVAATANCVRWSNVTQRLSPFVPTLGTDERRRRYKACMLVTSISTPGDGPVFHVRGRKMEKLYLEDIDTGEHSEASYKTCIPVKQSGRRPWFTFPNGIPCSLIEHTVRLVAEKSSPPGQPLNVPLEKSWAGEISVEKNVSTSIEIHLKGKEGTALIKSAVPIEMDVFLEHRRYERTVRLCLLPKETRKQVQPYFDRYATPNCEEVYREWMRVIELVSKGDTANTTTSTSTTVGGDAGDAGDGGRWPPIPTDGICYMDAELDAEGLRMTGTFRATDRKAVPFSVASTRRVSFAPVTTDLAHIEPLPECTDAIIPAEPARDNASVMHRLIVLLSRHLFMVICNQTKRIPKEFVDCVFLFGNHPLMDRLVTKLVAVPQLFLMVNEACQLIIDPAVKPWDAATLSRLVMNSLLLHPEASSKAPESLIWDAVHAVMVSIHRGGRYSRHEAIRNLTTFVVGCTLPHFNTVYEQLFATYTSYVDRHTLLQNDSSDVRKDVAAWVDLILTVKSSFVGPITNIPLRCLHCLIDLRRSLCSKQALPAIVDDTEDDDAQLKPPVEPLCVFGEFVNNELKVGKVTSSTGAERRGKYYYEVTLPDRLGAPFAVGWGTQQHNDVPSQHVGSDRASFAFNGADISTREMKEEYKHFGEIGGDSIVGCLLDMDERVVAWSVNGEFGPFVPIPIVIADSTLYAFISIGTCTGLKVRLQAHEFDYAPDGYSDLSGRHARVVVDGYDPQQRSILPVQPFSFYVRLVSYLSDVDEHKEEKMHPGASTSQPVSLQSDPREQYLSRYPTLADVAASGVIDRYERVISVVESCMVTASRFVDLDGDSVNGELSIAFVSLRPLVRRSFRLKLLVNIPPAERNASPPVVSARITELYSTLPRTPEEALQHTVLSQLYKQIGSFSEAQWSSTPLFKVNLYISGSSHAPIDMGGPYRQLWTFLSEEIMRHPDKCFPHSDYHRSPLFCFVENSQRVCLVPDSLANSSYELTLFNFFGKIMGYAARAKVPLDVDFSPFLWKFLVDEALTADDYYQYVDSVVKKSMEDDGFLMGGMAEDVIPGFADSVEWITEEETDESTVAQKRRDIAENCLVHSMDEQLSAIRSGLWSVLPRRVVRCLSFGDLERLVCGESNITAEALRKCIVTQLTAAREKFFWQIVEEMTSEQLVSLICFASGQRRLPLIRPITVAENMESVDHLPRAQSCSFIITVPPYATMEVFREKLFLALQHQMEMELA